MRVRDSQTGEHRLPACWFRLLAETDFYSNGSSDLAPRMISRLRCTSGAVVVVAAEPALSLSNGSAAIAAPIACHAEAVCEGRSILRRRLRFRRGFLSFARRFPRLWSSSVTNSSGFLLLFGSGRIALAPFLAFLTQLLLVQIRLELFIGKTTTETSGGNCQRRCDLHWPATRCDVPWTFV